MSESVDQVLHWAKEAQSMGVPVDWRRMAELINEAAKLQVERLENELEAQGEILDAHCEIKSAKRTGEDEGEAGGLVDES